MSMDQTEGETAEVVVLPPPGEQSEQLETVTAPAKVMRIGSMVKQLL